ncbi:MAG: DUF4395 family protein [Vicinamibacteria bacterium]
MSSPVVHNFMRQQGFAEEPPDACDMRFEGLYYQPRRVFPTILVATVLQLVSVRYSAALFFLVSALLWWNTLVPALNPFEAAYNRLVARPRGLAVLTAAPGPRRFAQGLAAALTLGAGAALLAGLHGLAWAVQAMLVVAFSLLLFGKFCLGAYVYHLIRGRVAFANSTLPWARG